MLYKKFGLLTVVAKGLQDIKWRRSTWVCTCECGKTVTVFGRTLRTSQNPSCGCIRYDAVSKAVRKYNTLADYLANTKRVGECLEWQGSITNKGYGTAGVYTPKTREKRSGLIHRRVYELVHGTVPAVVMHICDNPRCVNPKHLAGGTQSKNIQDSADKGRLIGNTKHSAMYKGKLVGLKEIATREGIPLSTAYYRFINKKVIF